MTRSVTSAVRRIAAAGATILLVSQAACGSEAVLNAPAQPLTVRAVPGLIWEFDTYEVSAGEFTLTLEQTDPIFRHTLVIRDADGNQIDRELAVALEGDIDSMTLTLEHGTYQLYCTIPGHVNMVADLTVD